MRGRRLSLFAFVDALGWELVNRYRFGEGLLGHRQPLETLLGYSSTCDPTFLTGLMPRDHGHFAFFAYDPKSSPFRGYRLLGMLPKSVTSRGRVRYRMSRLLGRIHGFTGYFHLYNMPFRYLHLFDYTERRDIFRPGGINSGAPTVFDHLRAEGIDFCLPDWHLKEEDRIAEVRAAVDEGRVTFGYLMLGALDAVLHAHGTSAPQSETLLRRYEALLKGLVEQASKRYDEVRLFVFSDHGMTDVTSVCNLMGRIEGLGLEFGRDYAAVYDATMARYWFLKEGVRERVVASLREEPQGVLLSDEDLRAYGCDFANHRYGELFFLMNPGVLICPSFMGEKPLAGMHGYAPADKDSVACLLSNVPIDPAPTRLDGMYHLMRAEAGAGREATLCA